MTIPSYDNRRSYAGNGSTTVFAFPPPFTANTDLVVQIQAADGSITTKVLGTDYTVTGAGNPAGGNVTMAVAPALTTTLIIYRDVPLTQSVDLQDGGPLPASTINKALDRITMWGQRLKEQVLALGTLATQTVAGLMSAADKLKLDGIQAGAQVNAVTSVAGKTGAVTLAKGDVGLGNVDNTSDANKPISTATQTALNGKLAIASNLSDLANVATARTNLGGGATGISVFQAATSSTALTAIGATATGSSLVTAANAAAARTTLGLVIGTDVQAFSQRLADIAGIAWAQGDILYFNGASLVRLPAGTAGQFFRTGGPSGTPDWASIAGGGDMLAANNLSDVANIATARTNLGGTSVGIQVFTATDAAAARTAIGAGTGSGNGTVTSVGLSVPAGLSVSGGPVTGSGAFAVTYAAGYQGYTTAEATKLSGIASGAQPGTVTSVGMSVPAFLSVSGSPVSTSGTFAVSFSGTALPVANGGTGATALATAANVQAGAAFIPTMDVVLSAMGWVALTDGATISVDHAGGVNRTVTIAGNRTIANPTNAKVGWPLNIEVTQDGTGSRTLSWGANFSFGTDGAPTLSTTAGAVDLLCFVCRSASKFVFVGMAKGI